jgi:hypothetical protein
MSETDLETYRKEIESGCKCAHATWDEAQERQAFFDYDGFRYEKRFRRDAETAFDFQGRSHRGSGFLRECIEILCEHLYSPGPARRWSEDSGNEFIQRVHADNLLNSLMLESDILCTLNDVAAIQIDAGEGDFAEKPITYRVWGREQFWVWCDPDSASTPIVCCTKDKYDEQTRYRLWNDTEVWTFLTKKLGAGLAGGQQTADGRVAYLQTQEKHDYGTLPFTFIHYRLPIRDFDVSCIGEFLWKAEIAIDDRLSLIDESIKKHINPIPVAEGVPSDWKPNLEAQRFVRMPFGAPHLTASGGYEAGDYARLYYLSPQIDVAGAWDDLTRYVNQCLESARVPPASVRMEQTGVASGISLMVEQEPLLKRAESRRGIFRVYESDLAKRTQICAGNHYGKPELLASAEAGALVCSWPQPRLAINTPDKMQLGVDEVRNGLKSHLMLIQDWYGTSREEALELAKQIAVDQADLEAANPDMVEQMLPEPEPVGPDGKPIPQQKGKSDG